MTVKMHPIHWLPRFNNDMTDAVRANLDLHCSDKQAGAEDGQVRYIFRASDVNDHYDRVVVASGESFTILAHDHCVCSTLGRAVLDCECNETSCSKCGASLIALSSVCDVGGNCMYDECGYCAHYRDACYADEVADSIKTNAAQMKSESVSWAEAYYQSIADELGQGADAPYFDAAVRVLNVVSKQVTVHDDGYMEWELEDSTYLYTRDKVWIYQGGE